MKSFWCGVVKVRQSCGGVERNFQSLIPEESFYLSCGCCWLSAAIEPTTHVTPRQVLINQKALAPLTSPTHENNEIGMPELAENRDFLFKSRGHGVLAG
jgi:hypothetical protein